MAASAATASSSSGLCPNYAVICSFLDRYGALLDLPELTFPQLERYLQDTSSVPKLLVDLHVKLLRKIGKSVSADRWEKYLVKVCQEFNTTWAWELEQKGYKELTIDCKTGILKYLCECQFDENVKFKTAINEEDPDKMRLQPIGRDKDGQMYWFQLDQDNNVRVYVEEQDDLDGSTWKCIVRDRNDLAEVVALLKTQIDPELLKKEAQKQETKPDGDEEKKGEEGKVKTNDDTSDEDNKDSDKAAGPVSPKTQNKEQLTQKENLKAEAAEAKSSLNGVVEGKTEAELRSEIVTAKTQNIKEEPMEVLDSKMSTATSEPAPEKPSLLVKPEKGEEAKRTSAEEIQQALKNDQQAKIPLKKRGMKFSEDFEKNSSIVIQNPPVSQVREASKADATQNINDHVNGEITPAAEKDLPGHMSKPLKEASSDREQATEPAEGKSAEVRERDSPATDRDGGKDEKDGAKKITGAVASHRTDDLVQKNLAAQVESESAAMAEKKEAHESPPLPKAESPPLSKDVNNAAEESLKHEKSEKMQEKPAITGEPSAEDKTTTLKETDKTLTTDESEKLNLNHEVTSKEAESKGSEEKVACVDVETSESSQAEEKKTTERTGDLSDAKQTGVSDEDAKELATSETKAEESTVSAPKEGKPGVIKTAEIQSANKDMPKKSDDSENTEIPSVIKKTEIVKEGHDTESQEVTESSSVIKKTEMVKEGDDTESQEVTESSLVIKKTEMVKEGDDTESQEVTESSPVIKKAETPSVGEKSEETSDIKEGTESSVIKKVEEKKSESCKPTEKHEDVKDTEVTPEGDCAASVKTEKPGDVKKIVNCDDSTIHDGTKTSNSTCEPMEVEAPASKQDLMKLQEDNKTEMNSVVHETTQETSEGKDKPSSPAEKSNISEDTDEKPKKEEEKVSEEQPQQPQRIETEHPSSESEKDAKKGKEKDAGKEKLAEDSEKHPTQDGERKEDSTIDESPKADEAKEEEHAHEESKTSPKTEKSGHQNESKEADVEPSTETEKIGQPSKEPSADKPTDEESKSKCREDEAMTKKEVANGGEAPTDIREEGIRRKAKPPAHRRKAELQREERQGDSESDTNVGRSLRRSPRISRPTPKAVEINDRKMEKSQTTPPAEKREESKAEKEKEKEEEEEEEAKEVKAAQKKPREKKADQEGQPKPKGRKRRKIRWSNTRTRRKKKGSEDDNSDEESSEEEESEEEDDSDEDYKVERSRKRRNRNRERRSSDSSTSSDDDLPPNDDPCKHCGLPNHPELILLCDSCDSGYHTACLRPPLMIIPDGEWFCPPCQHKLLCDKLEEQLQNLDAALKKKERAERRKERLIYVGISVENIITPSVEVEVEEEKPEIIIKEKKETKRSKSWGRRSTRTKKNISYRFDEFDEAIEEAIEEDIKEAEGGGAGRGKDMANITGHRGKDMSAILQAEEGKENGRPPRPSAGQRKKKRRRLNDLDSDSTVDEEESEEEFRLSESSEEEFVVSDNDSDAESEADSNDSDFGSNSSGKHRTSSRSRKPPKRRRSSRKRRRPRGYSDDEEDETDEDDEEDEIATEGSSEFSDSDLDVSRRRSRRSQKRQVNYCETSESEGSQAETNRVKMKPRRRQDSSESDASFSRDSEEDSRDRRVKRRADSSEEDSRQRRRRLALKRRRASEDDDSDDSSDDSSEEDRPIRKRVNRIDSDDDEEEQEEKPKEKKAEEESKGTNPLDSNLVELPPTNGQSPMKSLEGLISRPAAATATAATPGLIPHLEPPKNISATPATAAIAPNGLAGQEMAAQDDDEDDLLGVTDLVDYVCNNEQL